MMSHRWNRWAAGCTAALLLWAGSARAQTPPADPPVQAGRVAWLAGAVTLRADDGSAPSPVQVNWPVTGGDEIDTGPAGRAEVWVGSSAVRLDVDTAVKVERIDQDVLQLRLLRGALALRSASAEAARGASVMTPLGAVQPGEPGALRVDLRGGPLAITAWRGTALFDAGSGPRQTVQPGQRLDVNGTGVSLAVPADDDFRAFVQHRDAAFDGRSSLSSRYVSPEMTGAADLDAYGRWDQSPELGTVWTPTGVAADWAPYRDGRWVWVSPWGWTWVDAAPWGFAPFHYGRWALWQDRWCWVPGVYVARPVYAPALVAWRGGVVPARPAVGVSVSIGIGVGAPVGWYPLAPHEVYAPPYRVSETYVRNVNITHVTDVTRITRITNVTNVTQVNGAPGAPAPHVFEHDPRAATAVSGAAVLAQHERVAAHRVAFDAAPAAAPPGRAAGPSDRAIDRAPERTTERPAIRAQQDRSMNRALQAPAPQSLPREGGPRAVERPRAGPVERPAGQRPAAPRRAEHPREPHEPHEGGHGHGG